MAEAVISIAGRILANLITQALQKAGKLGGVKDQLVLLECNVSMLRVELDHAEEQYYQSPQIKDWVEKLKDAFYDAQDVLEEFNMEATQREQRGDNEIIKKVRKVVSSSNQLAFELKMSRKVRIVRERIEVLGNKKDCYLNKQSMDSQVERERRKGEEMDSFILKKDIIGRDYDEKNVKKFLLDLDVEEDISILPIVGIGGIGKTALAQLVYNDEMVSKHFHLKMWVYVSKDFDVKKVVENILDCVKEKAHSNVAKELLQRELRAEIKGKRYLLVLDDLWTKDPEKWSRLKKLLVGGARGSKILITTRLPSVTEITGTTSPYLPYRLGDLSESASINLLMKMACQKEEEIQDPEMLAIVREIAKKCSGVPLVVRIVGHLLSFKKTKSEWLSFKDERLPYVSQSEDSINSVLRLSYNHLPSHLKQCFAFCSLFPKGYEIQKQTLVNLWMAEGFIQPSSGSRLHLEDIAHGYFMDLLRSNCFQDLKKDTYIDEEICKMHDLMHDLACSVVGTECGVAWDDTKPIHEKNRHISYNSTSNLMGKPLISCLKASALRTFLSVARYKEREPTSEADLWRLIQSFKRLRILDLHLANVKKVPRFICKLKHLTYLDLSGNDALKRLPNSITRLHNLQTLNLNGCYALEELPRGIRKLVSLRNLDIDLCVELSYMPRGLGQLSSLHRLTCFILPKDRACAKKYCRLEELNGLKNIRGRLSIENLGSVTDAVVESRAANLIEKGSLEFLNLSWGSFNITDETIIRNRDEELLDGLRPPDNLQELIISGYNGASFPRWMSELPNLVALRLERCAGCKRFPQFALSMLKRLIIDTLKFIEYFPEEGLKSLISLESLKIFSCRRLTSVPLGLRHLSKLVDLVIWECKELDLSKYESGIIISDFHGLQSLRSLKILSLPKLESLPQWILQLRSLQLLEICGCDNLKALSEQIGDLQSLQNLDIRACFLLTSLPEGMRRLTSLTRLKIYNCPELEKRCERDVGDDWYKIAHIPDIDISGPNSLSEEEE